MVIAEVESANMVGYTEVTLTQKNTILGVNYTAVDGSAISLQDAIPYTAGMAKGANTSTADQIQIQTASGGYDIYFMSNGKNAKGGTVAGLEGKWTKDGQNVASATVPAGSAFWYIRNTYDTPLTIKIAGGVSLIAQSNKEINLQFKHIANPYPTDLPLNDGIPYVAGMTKGANTSVADQIQIQTASGGYDIYFMSNGKNAKGGTVAGLEGKWTKDGQNVADAAIPAGKGAWFIRKGSADFDLVITRPFSIE